jgi:hypothetical protein
MPGVIVTCASENCSACKAIKISGISNKQAIQKELLIEPSLRVAILLSVLAYQGLVIFRALKERLDEDTNYEQLVSYLKQYSSVYDLEFLQQNMFVIPVPFAKYHKEMIAHCKEMLEYQNGHVVINPVHSKLITALRTAVEKGDGTLDKEATSHDDST